jgi:hypothetical protein
VSTSVTSDVFYSTIIDIKSNIHDTTLPGPSMQLIGMQSGDPTHGRAYTLLACVHARRGSFLLGRSSRTEKVITIFSLLILTF